MSEGATARRGDTCDPRSTASGCFRLLLQCGAQILRVRAGALQERSAGALGSQDAQHEMHAVDALVLQADRLTQRQLEGLLRIGREPARLTGAVGAAPWTAWPRGMTGTSRAATRMSFAPIG